MAPLHISDLIPRSTISLCSFLKSLASEKSIGIIIRTNKAEGRINILFIDLALCCEYKYNTRKGTTAETKTDLEPSATTEEAASIKNVTPKILANFETLALSEKYRI